MQYIKYFFISLMVLFLSACGDLGGFSSGDGAASGDGNVSAPKAYFVDAGVGGLTYSSPSYQGETDNLGGFPYKAGEITTFSYAGLIFGSVVIPSGGSVFTPLDIFNTTDVNHQAVKNMLVLLQTLDSDQDPTNGISLRPTNVLFDPVFLNVLDVTDPTFQGQLAPAFIAGGLGTIVVIPEADAIAHFNETLLAVNAVPNIVGRWVVRDAVFGDVGATSTFLADQSVSSLEFETCSGNLWIASEASGLSNCSQEILNQTWSLSGRNLSMVGSGLSDSCTIIASSKYLIEANCVFQGSGLGSELTRLERDITQLSDGLVNNTYREVTIGGSTSFTNQIFNADSSGSYAVHNNAGVAQTAAGDLGDFTWSTTPTQISITGTDNGGVAFADTFTLQNQVRGALETSVGGGVSTLIPNFNPNIASSIISNTGSTFQVFDAITGILKTTFNFSDLTGSVLLNHSNNSFPVATTNGSIVIDRGVTLGNEICWPIASSTTSEGGNYSVLACSLNSSTAFNLEVWRNP